MNQSGVSIKACVDYFHIDPANILVIHDDLDLPLGRVKVTRNGGAGGHKGILSAIRHLGTNEFARLKIGIDRPRHLEPIEDYVLSPFYPEEKETIARVLQVAVEACELFLTSGLEKSMSSINHLDLTDTKRGI